MKNITFLIQKIKNIFLNDSFILFLIIANCILIFVEGFIDNNFYLRLSDNLITFLFIIEIIVKTRTYGVKNYFKNKMNVFDFVLIVLSAPSLIAFIFGLKINTGFFLIFRALRLFKLLRFFTFVPNIGKLLKSINNALKSSLLVFLGFVVYIFIIGMLSFSFFHINAPEHFGNPLLSLYSTFRVFTVEGWDSIPEQILIGNVSDLYSFFVYFYFVIILLTGGIFGMSLVNSVFVDAMVADNNDDLKEKIISLEKKIDFLIQNKNK